MSHAYVLVEYSGEQVQPATAELITAAKVFGAVYTIVVGPQGVHEALVPQLTALGADAIYAAYSEDIAQRMILPAVDAISLLAAQTPGPIFISAGVEGNEIAGRLAARLASGVLCNVVAVHADRSAEHSIFGDSVTVTAAVGGTSPIYTLRPGMVTAAEFPENAQVSVQSFELPVATVKDVVVENVIPGVKGDRPDLIQAKVVVAGGRGVESAENFATLVEPLADRFGGAVGATRDVVDLGWYAPQYQVGQTGVTVSPELYIGLGISGAIQHTSGMQTARRIIVINNDEDAPFFQIADLGVVADIHQIVPKVLEKLEQLG